MQKTREDRRQAILHHAAEEFAKGGYHATKIDDIVLSAKIARGTFYLYFADKRTIFSELVDRFFTRLGMAILRVDPKDRERTVEWQIKENIRRVLSGFLEDKMMAKIFITDALGVDDAFDTKLMSFYDEVTKLFMQSLTDGQGLGIVRAGDVRLYATFTMGGIKEILFHLVTRHWEYDIEALVEGIYRVLRVGFLLDKVAAQADGTTRKAPVHKKEAKPGAVRTKTPSAKKKRS
jgi:AcrR family transcriptional regulator